MNEKSKLWEKALVLWAASPLIVLFVFGVLPLVALAGACLLCGGIGFVGQLATVTPTH